MNFVLAHKDALKSLQVYYSTLPFVLFWLDFTNIFTLAPLSVSLSIYVPQYLLLWTLAPCSLALVPKDPHNPAESSVFLHFSARSYAPCSLGLFPKTGSHSAAYADCRLLLPRSLKCCDTSLSHHPWLASLF